MIYGLLTSLVAGVSLKVGDVAPDFTVADTEGREHTLSKMVTAGPVVLAFFPKAFTGGWTRELKGYRSRYADLEALDATVLAVSTDSLKKQREFRAKLEAPFPFIADPEAKLVEQFGVKVPVIKIANRVTFVIGAGRKIVAVIEGGDAIDPGKTIEALQKAR